MTGMLRLPYYLLVMGVLHDLGVKYWTDKAVGHNYMNFYEQYFEPIRYSVKNVLEIGVLFGASVRVWEEYFPNAHIYGMDDCYRPEVTSTNRFTYIPISAFNEDVKNMFGNNFFDIVIDDANHFMSSQREALKVYWPKVKPNGYFVMEDMHTSFWNKPSITPDLNFIDVVPSTYDFLVNGIHTDDEELNNIRKQFKQTHLFHNPPNHMEFNASITMLLQK